MMRKFAIFVPPNITNTCVISGLHLEV